MHAFVLSSSVGLLSDPLRRASNCMTVEISMHSMVHVHGVHAEGHRKGAHERESSLRDCN